MKHHIWFLFFVFFGVQKNALATDMKRVTLLRGWTVVTEEGETYIPSAPQPLVAGGDGVTHSLFRVRVRVDEVQAENEPPNRMLSLEFFPLVHPEMEFKGWRPGKTARPMKDLTHFSNQADLALSGEARIEKEGGDPSSGTYQLLAHVKGKQWRLMRSIVSSPSGREDEDIRLDANQVGRVRLSRFTSPLLESRVKSGLITNLRHAVSLEFVNGEGFSTEERAIFERIELAYSAGKAVIEDESLPLPGVLPTSLDWEFLESESKNALLSERNVSLSCLKEDEKFSTIAESHFNVPPPRVVLNSEGKVFGVIHVIPYFPNNHTSCIVGTLRRVAVPVCDQVILNPHCF